MPTILRVSDSFDRANETPLSGGGVWTDGQSGPSLLNLAGNVVVTPTDNDRAAIYQGRTWTNDQSSKAKLTTVGTSGGGAGMGLWCRMSQPGDLLNGYRLCGDHAATNNWEIIRVLNAVTTSLLVFTQAWTNADTFEFTVEGPANAVICKVYRNGTLIQTTSPDNSTVALPGAPGLAYSSGSTFGSCSINDWEGGELTVTSAPTAPLSLGSTPGNNQVALSWTVPASNGGSAITGYKIYRSLTTGTETLLASPAGTGTAYTDLTAVNGTTYFYKVSAVNAIGEGALSNETSATPVTVPTAPLSLVATAGDTQVLLSWSPPASNGGSAITAYRIYRSLTTGTETLYASPAGTGTTYTDVAASNGTTYYYKVLAVNAVGTSALSSEASATPAAPPPAPAIRTFKRFYGPTLLGNVATTLYTCPASTLAVVRHVHVSNPSASTVDFTFSIGTNAAGTRLWDGFPIPVDDVLDHYQDFSLAPGEFLQAVAGVGAILNLTVDGYEVGATPPPVAIFPSDTLFPSDTSP